ncbi:hypothetical protein N781_11430 [Pontibacillus halophilus JSM 076056 = DSM 19796]|uniref:Uncharacterized protein n=1 Tax=Pontibacillus halophilus JSM 076056 = DSM 19796 TaxID=1385510 RepID=A0A0A5GB58_9BACI|nr:hypothetical protein N781_11430 [Pontibacillus halophilus JSM 076056 = DSM 19796]
MYSNIRVPGLQSVIIKKSEEIGGDFYLHVEVWLRGRSLPPTPTIDLEPFLLSVISYRYKAFACGAFFHIFI